jgi:hypothetical protein
MENKINKAQIGIVGTICSKLKYHPDEKAAIISSFSFGRATSTTDLFFSEAIELIKHLREAQIKTQSSGEGAKMIGKIFYYAHEMGWTKLNNSGKKVADGEAVDKWMTEYSYLKKKLNKYEYKELPKLVSQFAQVYKSFLKSI